MERRRPVLCAALLIAVMRIASARDSHCEATRSSVLSPTSAADPAPSLPGTITIAALPDAQYYTLCRAPHLAAQLRWLAAASPDRDLRAAIFLGDITEHNSREEWSWFRDQLAPAADQVPLILTTGNHDEGRNGNAHSRASKMREFFPAPPGRAKMLLAERQSARSPDNAYYRIELPRVTLGILTLEWAPRQSTVIWANQVLSRHEGDRVIVVTHAYLYDDSTRYDWRKLGDGQKWNPLSFRMAWGEATHDPEHDGEMLWQALVRRHPGIFLVLCGHVVGKGTGLLASRGDSGNLVQQVMANFQMLAEGGLGYLRLFEIQPDGQSMRMKTYSPSLGVYATAPAQQAELRIEPSLW